MRGGSLDNLVRVRTEIRYTGRMQYAVPQFVEVEDRVVGPLTLRQFGFLMGGGVIILILSGFFRGVALIAAGVVVMAIAAPLAFLKINGRPLPSVIGSAFQFATKPQKRLWNPKANEKPLMIRDNAKRPPAFTEGPRIVAADRDRISALALQLDTAGTIGSIDDDPSDIEI